ncbi:hypothetical protein [Amniculibacterium aquaticum]|uniref:hypothetical protein n=1 Tax=Amniculibacterium aquaticum TaxID=2479858 RepID=UPI000F5AF77B|nr:hypothetical protein [Amniculibacterium aquaticum]
MENDFIFSSREFKAYYITDEHKEKLKSIYYNTANRLDNKLGREANFGDFIKSQIEQFGYDKVDEMFEGLKYAWSNIGRDTSDFKIVYYKYFHKSISPENEISNNDDKYSQIEEDKEIKNNSIPKDEENDSDTKGCLIFAFIPFGLVAIKLIFALIMGENIYEMETDGEKDIDYLRFTFGLFLVAFAIYSYNRWYRKK